MCASLRSRSTRCTRPRTSRRSGSDHPTNAVPACSRSCYGIAVRDRFPEHFLDAHVALFAARHEHAQQLKDESVLRDAVGSVGLDAEAVAAEVASGRPLETLAAEHTEAVERWGVFGVPTFIEGEDAVFVRFMERGRVDDLERMLDVLPWTRLNEFKRTKIPR